MESNRLGDFAGSEWPDDGHDRPANQRLLAVAASVLVVSSFVVGWCSIRIPAAIEIRQEDLETLEAIRPVVAKVQGTQG
jgi:hypothetical protein